MPLGEGHPAITLGAEPSTASVDEQLQSGADALGLDCWLLANRVVWPVLAAGCR